MSQLLSLDVACHVLKSDRAKVLELVDSGGLLWTFDLSSKDDHRNRLLRFWEEELLHPAACRDLTPEAVLGKLLPFTHRKVLFTRELGELASITRTQVHKLVAEGLLRGHVDSHVLKLDLESVREFLRTRLVR